MKRKLLDILEDLDSCTISDAMDKLGLRGSVNHMRQLTTHEKVVGRVVTVKLAEIYEGQKRNNSHLGAQAIDSADKDTVIVVDNQQKREMAAWGGILSTAAKHAGVRGVIVEGMLRDVDETKEKKLPVYALGSVCTSARGRVVEVGTNEPVTVGDIVVNPGDYVIGDGSGIVFISQSEIDRVLKQAKQIAHKEKLITNRILNGDKVIEAMSENYENMLQ